MPKPLDPKQVFKAFCKQQDEEAEAKVRLSRENALRRERERPDVTQPGEVPESEAAQWVRGNFEWEPYPSLWVPRFCFWSDYSGSYMNRANGAALLRDYADLFEEGHGGHGTVWVGIPEDKRLAMTDEQWEEIKDMFENLDDYPIIDDELCSRMEMEAKEEYWREYGRTEVREFLTKKFNRVGDVDASIAVAARRNEFWDTMLRDSEWEEHIIEEEGGDFYFDEERALVDVTRDDIVDDGMVEATKKQVFSKSWADGSDSFAVKLDKALHQAGVDVENERHLWQLVKYAEHVLGPVGAWEVSDRFHFSDAEVDVEEQISLVNVEGVVQVLSAPDAHQKMLRKHWAEDPRQLKLPGMESEAQALVTALLLDALDPKQAFRRMRDPSAVPRRYIVNMPSEIEIVGRFWRSRGTGNSYYTARISLDGKLVHTMPEAGSFGDQFYVDRSFEWLEDNGYIPKRARSPRSNMPEAQPLAWCQKHGISLECRAVWGLRRDRFREPQSTNESMNEPTNEQDPAPSDRPAWGRRILPQDQEQALGGIEQNRHKARANLSRLQQKLSHRPELHHRLATIGNAMDKSAKLIGKLRFSTEYRHELKRMALTPDRVRGLMPSRDAKWGEPPVYVIGVVDTEGNQRLFLRPISFPRDTPQAGSGT